MKISAVLGLFGALAIGGAFAGAGAPASAGEAVPPALARHLDAQSAAFTASEAKKRRMMIIQQNMNRQQHPGNRGYGGGYGGGYGRGPGYAPRPGYGYGSRPGYGHRRDYYDRPRY